MERLQIPLTSVLSLILSFGVPCACHGAPPQDRDPDPNSEWPQTRAERTDFRETSHYADVLEFIEDLQAKGAPVAVQFIGVSTQGHKIPLVIASRPPVAGPADARRSGKLVVYVQANIHAGEVEGKEAVLTLLRELARSPEGGLLDKIVLLTTPIYNIDGNETWGPWQRNRRSQNEPEVVGTRTNGQGLDLNRDGMKAESPEMRAALRFIYTTWDPEVLVDLHATNGTRHGYPLTYSPPLHPDTQNDLLQYNRDELLAAVHRRMRRDFGMETFVYGNVPRNGTSQGWYQSAPDPRRITNYVGLRNRLAILSEATCYLPFRQRVATTRHFLLTVLEEIGRRQQRILHLTREADARVIGWGMQPETAPALTVRYQIVSRGAEEILLEKATSDGGSSRARRITPPRDFISVQMPVYDRFEPTKTARFPAAYFIPSTFHPTVELLRRHGIVVEKLLADWKGPTEAFVIDEIVSAERPFQGHILKELGGHFESIEKEIPKGSYLVRTAQPLGILIFHLLEPESIDGVAAWGFLDPALHARGHYPIHKCFDQVHVATERQPSY
ncbi:MAG: hypothetical protein IIC50_23850 [Planctomycetes bacterium]|nr:hypothetical protein [Planctomycetota bacterium]